MLAFKKCFVFIFPTFLSLSTSVYFLLSWCKRSRTEFLLGGKKGKEQERKIERVTSREVTLYVSWHEFESLISRAFIFLSLSFCSFLFSFYFFLFLPFSFFLLRHYHTRMNNILKGLLSIPSLYSFSTICSSLSLLFSLSIAVLIHTLGTNENESLCMQKTP